MQLDPETQKKFPKFTHYLKVDFPALKSHQLIKHTMMTQGRMTEREYFWYLSWGMGPQVVVVPEEDLDSYSGDDFPREFAITWQVETFEKDSKDKPLSERPGLLKNARGQFVYYVGVQVLERIIRGHLWAKVGNRYSDEVATAVAIAVGHFERLVYGNLRSAW